MCVLFILKTGVINLFMKLTLYAVGTKMPTWVSQGFNEYARRFPRDLSFNLVEINAGKTW